MGAEFFSVIPRPGQAERLGGRVGMEPSLRRVHRWTSVVFTITVAANFVAMIWGQPPALITYSPLPPLLLLLLTGLYMLVRHQIRVRRSAHFLETHR